MSLIFKWSLCISIVFGLGLQAGHAPWKRGKTILTFKRMTPFYPTTVKRMVNPGASAPDSYYPTSESVNQYVLSIEAPMYKYMNGGVHMGYMGGLLADEKREQPDGHGGIETITVEQIGFLFEMVPFIRPQFPIAFALGHLEPALNISLGPILYVGPGGGLLRRKSDTDLRDNYFAFGIKSGLEAELAYFPWDFIGVYGQGGAHVYYIVHRDLTQETTFVSYPYFAYSYSAGIKIAF